MYTEFHKSHATRCKNQASFHVPMNLHKILSYKDINMNNIKLLSLLKLLQLLTGLFYFLKDGHYPLLGIKTTFSIVFLQEFMFLRDKKKIRTIIIIMTPSELLKYSSPYISSIALGQLYTGQPSNAIKTTEIYG